MKWRSDAGQALSDKARQRLQRSSQGVKNLLLCLGQLIGGWLLGRVTLFGGIAPLGLGFLGACGVRGGRLCGAMAAVGVMLGAVTAGGLGYGVKYAATSLLIYAAAFIFRDIALSRKRWFMPLITGAMTACIGFVYLRQGGFAAPRLAAYGTEVLLALGSCVLYAAVLRPSGGRQRTGEQAVIGLAALAMSLSLALAGVELGGVISPGRSISAFAVLTAAYAGGTPAGCLVGFCLGLALDAAAQTPGCCTLALGFAGTFGGIYRKKGRLPVAVCCVLGNAVASFWGADAALRTGLLYEFFIASVVYMLPSDRFYENLRSRERATGKGAAYELGYLSGKAGLAAEAFAELAALLDRTAESGRNDEDVMSVFDVAAEAVCRRCQRREDCWGRDYQETRAALLSGVAKMSSRGGAEATDFPQHFRDRCVNVRGFTEAVNRELKALYRRRQMKRRLRADRDLLYRQYDEFAALLRSLAAASAAPGREEQRLEQRIDDFLRDYAPGTECGVFRDPNGRLHVDIRGVGTAALRLKENWQQALSTAAERSLHCPQPSAEQLRLYETEPLDAEVGMAASGRGGKALSGDAARSFKTTEGILYLLLADGMGSGKEAAADSGAAADLAEKLLKAGVEPEVVMRILNTAMLLKSEKTLSCAGVDLMSVNLFTGETLVFKYGAAPTYIRCGEQLRTVRGESPAAGMDLRQPDCTRLRLAPGSAAVVVSDGAARAETIHEQLKRGGSPKELACAILTEAAAAGGWEDDMTVLTVKLEKHGEFGIS